MVTLSQIDVQRRRSEVEEHLSKAQALVETLRAELADLDAVERTFSRMSGAERRQARPAIRTNAPVPVKAAAKPETMTDMILAVRREFGQPMEPREIGDAIEAKGWGKVNRDAMRTRIWHMVREGKLVKVGNAYNLPLGNEKPVGAKSVEDTPTGLFSQPTQAGEGRAGGGT
jgi:hypothetical protein